MDEGRTNHRNQLPEHFSSVDVKCEPARTCSVERDFNFNYNVKMCTWRSLGGVH